MLPVLNKLFVRSFYKANASFFLFFFFIFFGAVQGGSLVSYHLSLMKSILSSGVTLSLVLSCWLLYHFKCAGFIVKIINSPEGRFLSQMQTLSPWRQILLCAALYLQVYAPVMVYGLFVFAIGLKLGFVFNAVSLLLFQVLSVMFFTGLLLYRLNHWMEKLELPSIRLPIEKNIFLLLFFHFTNQRKSLLFVVKILSLLLLYIILVWNRGRYDNDGFLLFYLVLLMAHAVLPFLAVQFLEKDFASWRNMPVSLFKRALVFLLPYLLLLLPETAYLFYAGQAIAMAYKLAYVINLLASMAFLTAIQYSDAQSREEYGKAAFALMLVSIFFLHVQAFWLWIAIQFLIASILFASGYYSFERKEA